MCKSDQLLNDYSKTSSSPPPAMQAGSDLSGSDGSESDDINEAEPSQRHPRKMRQSPSNQMNDSNKDANANAASNLSSSVISGVLHGVVWVVLALNMPYFASHPDVAGRTYQKALYKYDPAISLFDNTIWTYGTDYALAIITAGFAVWILHTSNQSSRDDHKPLARASAWMLVLYAISVGVAAPLHQFYLTVESRNTLVFRLLWTIVPSSVYAAVIPMGIIGNECLRIFQSRPNCSSLLKSIPCLTDTYWKFYGAIGIIACALGHTSFQRPACDIFIAGCTQTPPTFYCMAFLFLFEHPGISKGMRILGFFGFISNAILLPLYPFLVDTLGWSLGATNFTMHSNLCVAWSLQGLILQRIVKALVEETRDGQEQLQTKKVQ